MKILIAVDGSIYTDHALEFLASREGFLASSPEIEMLSVVPQIPAGALRFIERETLEGYYKDCSEKIFKPIRKSRGRSSLKGLFLGSVTRGVLARTKVPMLIVRSDLIPKKDGMRVGIAVDGSPQSKAVVRYILNNLDFFGKDSKFYLIHVTSDISLTLLAGVSTGAPQPLKGTDLAAESNITGRAVHLSNHRALFDHRAVTLLIADRAAGGLPSNELLLTNNDTGSIHSIRDAVGKGHLCLIGFCVDIHRMKRDIDEQKHTQDNRDHLYDKTITAVHPRLLTGLFCRKEGNFLPFDTFGPAFR